MNPPSFSRSLLVAWGLAIASPTVWAGTEMDRAFERLQRDYKALKTALEAPKEEDLKFYQKKADEMLVEARRAREMEPKMTATVPEAERPQFLERFRSDMDAFIANIEKLEGALKNAQWDEAKTSMETLWQNKKDGHKAYKRK
jgi:soluble cytochrome b562